MQFELAPAIVAGLLAGLVMEGPVYMQKGLGLPVKQNIFRTWGRMMKLTGGPGYAAGFLFHEALAAAIALIYALGFQILGADDRLWLWGVLGALIHYALAGPVVAMLPSLDPETEVVGAQGFAYRHYGALDVATSFVGHMAFGVLTAIFYALLHSMGGPGAAF